MEYTSEELSKVRIKTKDGRGIHELLPMGVDFLEVIPDLNKLESFNNVFFGWGSTDDGRIIARNKIISYINLMYSRELTCIKQNNKSFRAQKVECAILAKFDYDPANGRFQPEVEKMLMCENVVINEMIVEFCRDQHRDDEATLIALREVHFKGVASLMNNQEAQPDDILKWEKSSDALERMKIKILNGDETRTLTAALVRKIEEESLGLRPEDIAFRIRAGESPLGEYDYYAKE